MNGVSYLSGTAGTSTSIDEGGSTRLIATHKASIASASCDKGRVPRRNSRIHYAFALRCIVLLSVTSVFYVKFLIDQSEPVHLNSIQDNYAKTGRKLLHSIAQNNTNNTSAAVNCTAPSIQHFPTDGLTRIQRQSGFIGIHIFVAFYCFWFLASICDDYFVPAIEAICSTLRMQKDVVGATFMAVATSSPELFMNCVGTFVTKGDIGVGTIVGSAVFNILAVPACCGIFIGQYMRQRLDWWPITRDCGMYCLAVITLIGTLYDGKIIWYESLMLVMGYFIYMVVMYYNDGMARRARKLIAKYRRRQGSYNMHLYREVNELTPLVVNDNNNNNNNKNNITHNNVKATSIELTTNVISITLNNNMPNNGINNKCNDFADSPWHRNERCIIDYVFRWPITCLLWLTMPDSRRHPRWKYLTLLIAICWIGTISYVVAYVITIIGDTLDIPDSVMGLTILAAGMSVPEAVSSIIVAKAGHGAMGISNSIGSNIFDILLCLGLPWFVKAYFFPPTPGQYWITLNSEGFIYSAMILLSTLFGLYIAFVANKFVLNWKIGIACTVMYVGFLVIASMLELNFFFTVNLPICVH